MTASPATRRRASARLVAVARHAASCREFPPRRYLVFQSPQSPCREALRRNPAPDRPLARTAHWEGSHAPKSMRVAILPDDLSGGGVERTMLTLAGGFLKHGHAGDVVLGGRTGPLEGELPAGVRVVVLAARPAWVGPPRDPAGRPGRPRGARKAGTARAAKTSRPHAAAPTQPGRLPAPQPAGRARLGQVSAEPVRGLGA